MTDTEKKRLTLWLEPRVIEQLKRQAKNNGVSVSAYVSMTTMQKTNEKDQIGGIQDYC